METFTEDERGALSWYRREANQVGLKALRIIDDLTLALESELEGKSALLDERTELIDRLAATEKALSASDRALAHHVVATQQSEARCAELTKRNAAEQAVLDAAARPRDDSRLDHSFAHWAQAVWDAEQARRELKP